MKNLVILLFINISFFVSPVFGMEDSEQLNIYSIITNDQHISEIPQQHLNMCNVITIMLGDLPNNTNPLPLPISKAMLPLLKKCLENSYITQDNKTSEPLRKNAQQKLEKLLETQVNLHTILSFAQQLDAPYLLNQCIEQWATTNYIPTQQYPLPEKINIDIAQRMPRSKILINDVAAGVIEDLEEKKITLHEKTLQISKSLFSAAISKNGKLFAGGDSEGTITIYNYETGQYQQINTQHNACYTLQFNNNDSQILSSGKGSFIKIWDLENGDMSSFYSPLCRASVFRYIPEHELLIADGLNNELCIWNIADSKNLGPEIIDAHTSEIITLESTHDGSLFATGSSDRYAHVWDTATKKKIISFFCTEGAVMSTQFNHTKNKLLCGLQNGTIYLYDLETTRQIWNERRHNQGIWSVLFTDPDDTLFCSGSKDATINLWDYRAYKFLTKLYGHTDYIQAMAIDHEKNKLVSTSLDTTMKIWDLRKLITPIKELRHEFGQSTIEQINMLKNADIPDEPINIKKSCYKNLFEKFSPQAKKFLLKNENITYKD